MKYYSKPVEIEAFQFTGNVEVVNQWMRDINEGCQPLRGPFGMIHEQELWVIKSNRWCEIKLGTYIIAESDGVGVYPCVPDEFERRYSTSP